MTVALEVSALKKSFGGVAAVKGIDFSVLAGEAVALIGPNGAGKTTSFNLINGQLQPDSGRVRLNGVDITGKSPEALFRMGVARTFQITATFGSMSVCENVQMMDEPTAGMAPTEREALMRLAVASCRERNVALLFTEHDMDVVFTFADRVIVMNRGRIIASGTPDEVRANQEVRAVYLGGVVRENEATNA